VSTKDVAVGSNEITVHVDRLMAIPVSPETPLSVTRSELVLGIRMTAAVAPGAMLITFAPEARLMSITAPEAAAELIAGTTIFFVPVGSAVTEPLRFKTPIAGMMVNLQSAPRWVNTTEKRSRKVENKCCFENYSRLLSPLSLAFTESFATFSGARADEGD